MKEMHLARSATVLSLWLCCSLADIHAEEQYPDNLVVGVLHPKIENLETLTLKPMHVAEFEKLLSRSVSIGRAGLGDVLRDYYEIPYNLDTKTNGASASGMYKLAVLARKQGDNVDNAIVVNVKLEFIAPSGAVYSRDIAGTTWPIERREVLRIKEPKTAN